MIMKLTRTLLAVCLCLTAMTGFAQKAKDNPFFRFATKAEAQMLITDIDEYTNNWNQFDINARLQNNEGRKSQLLTLAMSCVQNWSEQEKKQITTAFNAITAATKRQKLTLNYPDEIILVKTSMQEEGGASAYTRKNWIAINEDVLNKISAAQLQILVAHELFHILTRYDLNFKKSVYQTIGFTVLDREIIFPTDIMEKRISNPDISRYDSYAPFTVKGTIQNYTMMTYTDRPYTGGDIFDYMKIGLIPLNDHFVPVQESGKTVIVPIEQAEDFYEKIGKNTNYVINPEEVLADNFAYMLTEKKDLPNPEVISRIREVLKK